MVVGFTRGFTTIMAAETATGNTAVIKESRGPYDGAMTVITAVMALYMVGRFSSRFRAIVAFCTGAYDSSVINPYACPVDFSMTVITIVSRLDVFCRLFCGCDIARLAMAVLAASWCAFKNTLGMAGITAECLVCSIEQVAGLVVVKFRRLATASRGCE